MKKVYLILPPDEFNVASGQVLHSKYQAIKKARKYGHGSIVFEILDDGAHFPTNREWVYEGKLRKI